jgi:hypothetical protein
VPHSEELPVPERPESEDDVKMDLDDREMDVDYMDRYTEYGLSNTENPHLITQAELNELVRDLNLFKNQVELPGSRLQGIF